MPRPESLIVAVLLTLLVSIGPISTDLYLPSLPSLTTALATDITSVQLTLSVFLAGFAFSQLLYGPLSDRFGRRPALMVGLILFVGASILCMLANSIEMLIAARFLQAVGACSGHVLGRAVVRDVYGRDGAARMLAYIGAAMALAPAIGPILGGYLTVWLGWRANFLLLTFYGMVALAGVWFLLAETNVYVGRATGVGRMLRDYTGLLRHRAYLGYILCIAMTYCGLFAFISGSSFVFIDVLGLPPDVYGYCFAAAVVGYIAGAVFSGRMVARLGLARILSVGVLVLAGAGLSMAGLVLAGIETVWSVLAPMVVYMAGVGLVLPNALAGALGPFPERAGAAAALSGFSQMGFAALVGIGVGVAFDGTARPMAVAIALSGCAAVAAWRLLPRDVRQAA